MLFVVTMWCYFSCSGIKDAILWSGTKYNAYKWNEHILFVAERISVGLAILFGAILFKTNAGVALMIFLGVWLCFPFWHNGFYYWQRNYISKGMIYPKKFKDFTEGSGAKINFEWKTRWYLGLMGIFLIIVLSLIV